MSGIQALGIRHPQGPGSQFGEFDEIRKAMTRDVKYNAYESVMSGFHMD